MNGAWPIADCKGRKELEEHQLTGWGTFNRVRASSTKVRQGKNWGERVVVWQRLECLTVAWCDHKYKNMVRGYMGYSSWPFDSWSERHGAFKRRGQVKKVHGWSKNCWIIGQVEETRKAAQISTGGSGVQETGGYKSLQTSSKFDI